MKAIALFCLALGLGVQAAQFPFPHKDAPKPPAPGPPGPPGPPPPPPPRKPDNAYDSFVEHFSEKRSGTDTYLQTTIASLYPNSTLVVTQDYRFNPFAYAAQHPDKVVIREMTEEIESLKQVVYIPRLRRRDGDGVLGEVDSFNGYRIAWGDHELVVIVASWREGYSTERQWHLLTEHKATSERFILDVAAFYSTIHNAILVFDQGYWHPDYELWRSVQKASWDDVILDEDFKHRLTGDYRSFFKSEKIYKDLGVPWKRGLIFLGPPGNGKTISLKAIMKDSGVAALYVKTLKSYSGDEAGIREVFTRARAEAPCVLVFEDLDSLITDENRSFFLNEVDGLEENDGLLLIGTTNHVERLDPALSSRPSRFDRKYTFADPKKTERRAYAVYWQDKLKQNKDIDFPDSLLDTVAEKTNKFSFAYLKEAFVSALVTLAIKEEEEKVPQGHDFPKTLLEQIRRLREQLDEDEGHEFGALSNNLGRQSKGGRGQDLPPLGGAEQAFFMGMGMGEEERTTSREKSLRDGRAGSGYIAMDEHKMRGERLVRIPSEL